MSARRFSLVGLVSLCVLCGSFTLVCVPAQASAGLEGEWVTEVTAESVRLDATIDPKGELTTYYFQYGLTSSYGTDVPAAPGAIVGAGAAGVEVGQLAQGLQAASTYHFRVVAVSETAGRVEEVDGPDQVFTTQARGGSFALPDGRQYEMVSPPEKHGAYIDSIWEGLGLVETAADGDALTYVSRIPTEGGSVGFANVVQNLSVRGSVGWRSRDLAVPHATLSGDPIGNGTEYRFFSSDLSHTIVQPLGVFTPCTNAEGASQPCLSPEASEPTAFLSTDFFNGNVEEPCLQASTYCARPFVSGCPKAGEPCPRMVEEHADVTPGTIFGSRFGGEHEERNEDACEKFGNTEYCGPKFVAATPDLSHVLLVAEGKLTPEAPPPPREEGPNFLYEWSAGHLTYVGEGELEQGGTQGDTDGPISTDGSRVVFQHSHLGAGEPSDLVMRDTVDGEAVQVGGAEANYQAMSSDGSRVFFSEGGFHDNGESGELDVFETAAGNSVPLTGTVASLTGGAGRTGQVLGVSEDGSYVYFVSDGVIAGSGATGPGPNLYVDHYTGSEWKPSFIATLSTEDGHDWVGDLEKHPTRVSPDGQWLAFMSAAPLTDYDNHDAVNGRLDAEVYLYHAATGESAPTLTCASCNPTGQRPTGAEYNELVLTGKSIAELTDAWETTSMVAADVPGWQQDAYVSFSPEEYQSRYLSDSGRLFFNSEDSLVPNDVDGTQDVYQYEPQGVGSCSASSASGSVLFEPARGFEVDGRSGEQAAGCVGLISSGTSSEGSSFLDASQNGSDVFFRTASKLAPQDEDSAFDIYDAHECTVSSPCPAVVVAPPPCETESSCRPSPTPQPQIYAPPASATFSGPGDLTPPPASVVRKVAKKSSKCGKGFVKKHDKCVRKKPKRAKRASEHGRAGR